MFRDVRDHVQRCPWSESSKDTPWLVVSLDFRWLGSTVCVPSPSRIREKSPGFQVTGNHTPSVSYGEVKRLLI
jgi:hypothetical protein